MISQVPGSIVAGIDPGEDLIDAIQIETAILQLIRAVQVSPDILAIVPESRHGRTTSRSPDIFFDPALYGIMNVRRLSFQRSTSRWFLLGFGHLILVVVSVVPGLGAGALGLLDHAKTKSVSEVPR
jgi:hypothetical protein